MECIIGSILLNNEAKINAYNDISHVIDKIKENKAIAKYVRAYGHFAVEREETSKKFNFIFICQKCFKCYNLFRFYINSFFIFFGVFSLSTAKLPYSNNTGKRGPLNSEIYVSTSNNINSAKVRKISTNV